MSDNIDHLSAYDFPLPKELIAQTPPERRGDSRLMLVDRTTRSLSHHAFADLPHLLTPGDLLVMNATRVIPGRIFGKRETSGGRVEVLLEAPSAGGELSGLVKANGKVRENEVLVFGEGALRLLTRERCERGRWTFERVDQGEDIAKVLEAIGKMPLPPYIRRDDDRFDALDRERYQTLYAKKPGAIAAPTAGLHFTHDVLEALDHAGIQKSFVDLEVGLGTFRPIEVENLDEHAMHEESFTIDENLMDAVERRQGRLICVGTTSLRAMESAANRDGSSLAVGRQQTDIFIRPPHNFLVTEGLLTNFHLPKSSLILLVAALADRELILQAYAEAVKERYRFFSYGDAMLIL